MVKKIELQKQYEDRRRWLWHSLSPREVLKILDVDPGFGLPEREHQERRKIAGKNILTEEKPTPKLRIFLEQFKNPLVFILVIAGVATLIFKEYTDSIVIFGAILLNTFIGYLQEYKATKALTELKKILKVKAVVIREGKEKEIFQEELVPGDIVVLNPGNKVPADGRIIESDGLKIQEAVLTGEWLASEKNPAPLPKETPLADRNNMAYMGTIREEGNGKMVITATGMDTEIGKVAGSLQKIREEQTPYQEKIARFSWIIGSIIAFLAGYVFLVGILTGRNVLEMFTVATAIAVAAIPEGLPVAITIILAVGMQRIVKQHGLVRRLASAETLGSTSIIATDKTLTLTEGKMEVEEIFVLEDFTRETALTIAAFANEAFIENPEAVFEEWIVRGRPTDRALLMAAIEIGIHKVDLEKKFPLVAKIPFNSQTKYIASFHKKDGGVAVYLSGAPEALWERSSNLPDAQLKTVREKLKEMTERGLRVVAVGFAQIPLSQFQFPDHHDHKIPPINFVGLIALKDPLRKGVKEAIRTAKEAGIRTIIVTGDHLLTAKAVAKELEIDGENEQCIEGKELDRLSDEEFEERIEHLTVYGRVEPAHKLRIIEAWQHRGQVIAMTGDGVNDAPALKKADIGLALGSGTDVAKEVSDLVLLNDNFAVIPAAIREGRVIIDNSRKIITYLLSGSFTETILIGASLLLKAPFLPVTALQILWINLVEDIFPAIALSFEGAERDVMTRPPEKKERQLLDQKMKVIIFLIGIITDLILLGLFFWLLSNTSYSPSHIQTIIFVGLGINSLFYVFSVKSLRKNIWEYNPFSNSHLVRAVLLGFALLFMVIYIPFLQNLFRTEALGISDWGILFGLGIGNLLLIEAAKWYFIKKERLATRT